MLDANSQKPALVKNTDVYLLGDLLVAPYPQQDDLGEFYLKVKRQELLPVFFHEDEQPRSLCDFLLWAMERDSYLIGAYKVRRMHTDGLAVRDLIGVGKVGPSKLVPGSGYRKAEVGMFFDRDYQIRSITLPACQMMLELVFDRLTVDVLYGTIPEKNRASLRFMRAIGFERTGPIAHYTAWRGKPCGAFVSWMSAEHWPKISPFR